MDENKEKLTGNGDSQENVREEMEELAKVFKEELDKAKAEAEKEEFEELQVEGYDPKTVSVGEKTAPLSEDELCEYCGEKRRGTDKDPKSPYCQDCEAVLEKYPYDYRGFITIGVVICLVLASVFFFALDVPVFSKMMQGDKLADEGKLYSAMEKYNDAVELSENSAVEGVRYNLYAKRALLNYRMVNMNSAIVEIDEYIPDTVLKLLTFSELQDILDDMEQMQASAMVIQQHLNEFPDISEKNYDDIIAELDSLSGKKVYVKGSEYHDETEEDFTPDGSETVFICDEGWINMYKYAAAQELEKDPEIIAGFLQKCADSSEYMKTLVGSLLATTYSGMGDYEKAEKIADEIRQINGETVEWHMIQSVIYRNRDKDYEKALKVCDEGLKMLEELPNGDTYVTNYGYIIYIQQALNYIMTEEYDTAYEVMTECYYDMSIAGTLTIQVRDLYAVLALETGDKEMFESLELEIDAYGDDSIAFSSDVTDYKAGKITLQEIAESGRYDLI